ncbi:hypothetical protein SSX86_019102 [Deinandra increscens subsp. villosa]|uniref:BZIP domain-containing protein n=1 Tax=Deinandra increscens subsp. villosa TaxID=3103831 RepID=A0AAP0GSQ3_9ASTR
MYENHGFQSWKPRKPRLQKSNNAIGWTPPTLDVLRLNTELHPIVSSLSPSDLPLPPFPTMLSSIFPTAVDHISPHGLFGTTWDTRTHENNQLPIYPTQQPPALSSFSGSDNSTLKTNSSGSGSDDESRRTPFVFSPTDDRPIINDRKRRRMISNRESARRSRMRKQHHLESLRNLVNRHESGNRELLNRLRFALHRVQVMGQENERLQSESVMLRQRLWDLDQEILLQLPKEL